MMPKLPSITFQEVCFSYGSEKVLTDFSFQARPGKHTVIKGESGSGKSTILKLILGFLQPSAGSINVTNGAPYRDVRKHSAWLPPGLNIGTGPVREIMQKPFRFDANQQRMPEARLMHETLEALGLGREVLDKDLRDLSTGQRQRVGIGLCHLLNKPLLLLDEPTSSLDEESKNKVKELLLVHTNYTVISTSHDPSWIETADDIVTLD